jgi:hypothetical protein
MLWCCDIPMASKWFIHPKKINVAGAKRMAASACSLFAYISRQWFLDHDYFSRSN